MRTTISFVLFAALLASAQALQFGSNSFGNSFGSNSFGGLNANSFGSNSFGNSFGSNSFGGLNNDFKINIPKMDFGVPRFDTGLKFDIGLKFDKIKIPDIPSFSASSGSSIKSSTGLSPELQKMWDTDVDTSNWRNIQPYNDPTNEHGQIIKNHWNAQEGRIKYELEKQGEKAAQEMAQLQQKHKSQVDKITGGDYYHKMQVKEKGKELASEAAMSATGIWGTIGSMLSKVVGMGPDLSESVRVKAAEDWAAENGKSFKEGLAHIDEISKNGPYVGPQQAAGIRPPKNK